MSVVRIKSIKKIENVSKRYDIETSTENFFANGILVHNSFIGVFNYKGQWVMSTRGTINGTGTVGFLEMNFRQLFDLTVSQYPHFWNCLEPKFNYCFELVSPESKVVKPYANRALYLTGMRDTEDSFKELAYNQLKIYASNLGVKYPAYYEFTDIAALVAMAAGLKDIDEGFVVVNYSKSDNGSFPRLKVKNPAYVALSHIKESSGTSYRSLMQLVMHGEVDEFTRYFPEYKPIVDRMDDAFRKYCANVGLDFIEADARKTQVRSEYAAWAKTTTNPGVMFMFYDGKVKGIRDWINKMTTEKGDKNTQKFFLKILNVNDMELNVTGM